MKSIDINISQNLSWHSTLDFPRISHAISARYRRAVRKLFPDNDIYLYIDMVQASNNKISIIVYKDWRNPDAASAIGQQVLDHLMSVMTIAAKDCPSTSVTRCLAAICLQHLHEEKAEKPNAQPSFKFPLKVKK